MSRLACEAQVPVVAQNEADELAIEASDHDTDVAVKHAHRGA